MGEETIIKLKKRIKELEKLARSQETEIRELSALSDRDILTELYNRRGFVQEAEKFLKEAGTLRKITEKRLISFKDFSVIFIDLDNFKSFNDNYGFEKGDVIIKETANFIIDAVKNHGTVLDMIGHIGGDDFIVVSNPECAENICLHIIKLFDENISAYYSDEDRARGYIISKDRLGKVQAFPLMSVSIGIVTNEIRNFTHYAQLAELAAEVKAVAKEIPKSSYFKDRRKS